MKRPIAALILAALLCPLLCLAAGGAQAVPGTTGLLNDSLVTLLDFEGETEKERLKDKAPAGNAYDSIAAVGSATVAGGIATAPAEANAYLSLKATESSDVYDLKGKTLIFRAKMQVDPDNQPGAVNAFLDAPAVSVTVQNAASRYQILVTPRVDGANRAHTVTGAFAATEFCTYAVVFAHDEAAKTVTFRFYQCAAETPTDEADFRLLDSWSETYTDAETTLCKTGNWYFGKRSGNNLGKNRLADFLFEEIRVYDKALDAGELLSAANGEADRIHAAANADVQVVATQTAEHSDSYDIRFIGVVGSLDYRSVGFEIVATYADGSRRFCREDSKVYTTLLAVSEDGIAETVTAEELGGSYLVALTVTGIPRGIGAVSFRVTPFAVTQDGTRILGAEKTVQFPVQ